MSLAIALLAAAAVAAAVLPAQGLPGSGNWLSGLEPVLVPGRLRRDLALLQAPDPGCGTSADRLLLAQLATAGTLLALGLLLAALHPSPLLIAVALVMAAIGYTLPARLAAARAELRREGIRRALPSLLLTLAVVTEAGLPLLKAMEYYCAQTRGVLPAELAYALQSIRYRQPVESAFLQLARRVEVRELTLLMGALIQAIDKGGEGLPRVLRDQATLAWDKRRRRAQELGQQASIKLFIPLAGLVLPALLAITAGPGIFIVLKHFGS